MPWSGPLSLPPRPAAHLHLSTTRGEGGRPIPALGPQPGRTGQRLSDLLSVCFSPHPSNPKHLSHFWPLALWSDHFQDPWSFTPKSQSWPRGQSPPQLHRGRNALVPAQQAGRAGRADGALGDCRPLRGRWGPGGICGGAGGLPPVRPPSLWLLTQPTLRADSRASRCWLHVASGGGGSPGPWLEDGAEDGRAGSQEPQRGL